MCRTPVTQMHSQYPMQLRALPSGMAIHEDASVVHHSDTPSAEVKLNALAHQPRKCIPCVYGNSRPDLKRYISYDLDRGFILNRVDVVAVGRCRSDSCDG